MNKRYLRFKELGLCRRCGSPPIPGKIRCDKCNKSHLNYQNKNKIKLIEQGFCRSCGTRKKLTNKSTCQECLDYNKKKEKIRYSLLRAEVLKKYDGHCICCGNDNNKYLQLDHINNDGKAHRLELSGAQKGGMYAWAKRNNFPRILQILCSNCHQAKTNHGGCTIWDHPPHYLMYSMVEINEIYNFPELSGPFKEYKIQLNPYGIKYSLFNQIAPHRPNYQEDACSGEYNVEKSYAFKKELYSTLFCNFSDLSMSTLGIFKSLVKWRLEHGK